MNFELFFNKKLNPPEVACAISCGKIAFLTFLSIVFINFGGRGNGAVVLFSPQVKLIRATFYHIDSKQND